MKTCPYCGTGVDAGSSGSYYCGFCEMKGFLPSEDGARKDRYGMKEFIDHSDINKTTPELMTYHTGDLLRLLKVLREGRRDYFHHITTFKKAGNETDEFKQDEKEAGDEYENLTRKTWIVENILKDRIGYIPQRVTDQLLETVYNRVMQERNQKPMIIKKNEPSQELSKSNELSR